MIAANLMTTDIVKLTPSATMRDVIKEAVDEKIRLMPVVNGDNEVVGVVTPRSLMKAILPKYITEGLLEDVAFAPDLPQFIENIDSMASKKVSDIMDREFASVQPETSSMEVAAIFIKARKPVESILVVDDKKRLLGIISPWDIFKRLWEYAQKNKK